MLNLRVSNNLIPMYVKKKIKIVKSKKMQSFSLPLPYAYRLYRNAPCRNLPSINKKLYIQKSSSAEILIMA